MAIATVYQTKVRDCERHTKQQCSPEKQARALNEYWIHTSSIHIQLSPQSMH